MKSLSRKSSTSGRIRGALVAALLLPAALLTLADIAAAQGSPEPPAITVYHSLDSLGADPRSGTVPAGCTPGTSTGGGGAGPGPKTVAVFDNPSFVNTAGGLGSESDTIQASLAVLGHTVTTFTGISAADWQAAGASADVILIPELETGDLFSALDTAAQVAIADYVAAGGRFIMSAVVLPWDTLLLNNVFDFALVSTGGVTATLDAAVAAGTPFEGGPGSLAPFSATDGVTRTSLPAGALDVYHDASINTVFVAPVGAGSVAWLGWDWFDATPLGGTDGGWNDVLDRTLDAVAGTGGGVPEPVCVIGGEEYEELRLWIDGGPTSSAEYEYRCSRDTDAGGDSGESIEGGNGDEICGAALTFQIQGIGRFSGAISAPEEEDPGIDTIVLGTDCTPGVGDECIFPFPEEPPVKQLTLNFRLGGASPPAGPRFLGSLIVDSRGLDTEVNYSLISVFGEAAGAKLQLRSIASGETPETIADTRLVPEPGQLVQLLSGLFALAGLSRLRRKN